jgi:hypothetical protein
VPITAPAPVSASTPSSAVPVISPQTTPNAFKGNLGGGYGASNIEDQYSGKPLLTYEDQATKTSDLLANRVAPTFDPTIPQKIDPSVLHNGRMPEAASEAVRKATGAEPDEQLDHLISLELGGSNDTSNLNLEKLNSSGVQPSLDLENQTAAQVASGKISYIDGQKIIARAKGIQLPDDNNFSSSPHPLASAYPNPAPNQVGTQAQKSNMFNGLLTGKTTSGQPTILSKIGNYVKDAFTNPGATSKPLFNALGGNAVVHPIITLNTIVNNAKQGADSTLQNLASSAKSVVSGGQSASQKTASVLNFLTSAASTLFFPVSETFNIASQLPVIKPAADATGLIFTKTGQVGGFAADKLLSALPISSTAKANLATAVQNVGTLAGQVILGGHIYGAITGAMDAKGEITPEHEQQIVADANDKAEQLNKASMPDTPKAPAPVESPAPKAEAPAKKTTEAAPVEPQKTSSLPSWAPPEAKALESETAKPSNGPAPLADAVSARPGDTPAVPSKTMPAGALRPIEGIGDTKTRGLSEGVLDKAISNTPSRLPDFAPDEAKVLEQKQVATKLADTFGDLPQYKQMDVADQGARAIKLFEEDPESARQIAYGAKAPPKGLTPEAVFIAVEQDAQERGDGQTLRELANSRLTSEATTMGQRLRMLAERNPENPTDAVRSVQEAREKAAEAQNGGKNINVVKDKVTDDITKEITKASAKPRDWASFVQSITC